MSEILNEDSLIKVNNVSFSYASKQIYKNLSLNIPKGKITAILGPSGTGKTTILRLIGAQLVPDEGTIEFDGINVHSLKRNELYELRKRMSMLFQSGALFSDMNVFVPEELIHDVVLMNLEAVGMRAAAYLYPSELSGGMARRAALARSIALDPDLIMYDEPFVGQDPITKGVLVKLIADINKSLGKTSVVVTHDVKEILEVAHYVYILSEGSVLGSGTPQEIGPYAFKLKGSQNYIEEL